MKNNKKPTPEMKAFLLALADLMVKHDVSIEAIEETRGYATWCDGIEFQLWGGAQRETCTMKTNRTPDAKDLRELANTQ